MYAEVIQFVKNFVHTIGIDPDIINPELFQGVFVKRLSNQNIPNTKRKTSNSKINQTHIDITGVPGKLFFFDTLSNATTPLKSIDIDILYNNYMFIRQIDHENITTINSIDYYRRKSFIVPSLAVSNKQLHCNAYKKFGHNGKQGQINLSDPEDPFSRLQKHVYYFDALILLKYNSFHYLALIIPFELCQPLYTITNTPIDRAINVNVVYNNASYNIMLAEKLQRQALLSDVMDEDAEIQTLQNQLNASQVAGTDIQRTIKTRISQGAFRRLLLLTHHHKCCICDITNTSVLRASHIKSWAGSSPEERMDASNGLLLCANHDALFDKHLITFNSITGKISISKTLDSSEKDALNINESLRISPTADMQPYLAIHNQIFSEQEKNL